MPSYTLYYFNYRGRAEVCRMLFTAANTQYHDKRIEPKEWDNFKSKMPCSMMPVLEIDGKTQIPQSMAIARYLAREFGFYGKNNIEMARIDYISDCVYELMDDYLRMYYDKDGKFMHDKLYDMRSKYMDIESKMGVAMRPEGQSDSQGNEILGERRMMDLRWRYNDTCNRVLPFLERTLEMYNSGNQFFMGDVITMADMMFLSALENPLQENPNILSRYPKLTALKNRISSHQKLSTYLKTRFLSDF